MNSTYSFRLLIAFITTFSIFLSCSSDDGPKNPVSAVLILPTNGENCNTGSSINASQSAVEFSWNKADHVSNYFLEVVNMQTNQKFKRAGIIETTAVLNLDKGYPYEWFVTSVSEDFPTERPVSDTWRFYLQGEGETNSAPFTADLISPQSGETVQLTDGSYNFVWAGEDPDGDSMTYTLFVDTVDGLQTPPEEQTNISSSNLSVMLNPDTIYYWGVHVKDSQGNISQSQVQTFRVQ
jgi:hypothetical protein